MVDLEWVEKGKMRQINPTKCWLIIVLLIFAAKLAFESCMSTYIYEQNYKYMLSWRSNALKGHSSWKRQQLWWTAMLILLSKTANEDRNSNLYIMLLLSYVKWVPSHNIGEIKAAKKGAGHPTSHADGSA